MGTVVKLEETMQAPHFVGRSRIETVIKPLPLPGPGQLLIQVRANALCGSERGQFLHGSRVTPGHEAAGVVAAVGPETRTPVGTAGAIFLMDYCRDCRSCRHGFTNQCLHKRADMGFSHDGGYAPYELIHENIFFPIGTDVSPVEATLLLDIMGTGGHAIARGQAVRPDIESLYVAGAGPIGLGTLAMAKILYGETFPVFISDRVPYRLELAAQLGGRPIPLDEQTPQAGLRAHGHETVDLAIDTSGKQTARRTGMEILGKRGALICVGHGEGLELTVSPDLIAPERAVLGSEYFCYHELPANLQRLHQHRDYLNQIITHRYGVSDIQEAFETFFAGNTGKVIIEQ